MSQGGAVRECRCEYALHCSVVSPYIYMQAWGHITDALMDERPSHVLCASLILLVDIYLPMLAQPHSALAINE